MKRALITGITGQDGSYLAELLLEKGYKVYGTMRRKGVVDYGNVCHIVNQIQFIYADLTDLSSLIHAVKISQPDEVYNLAAQSFVRISWEQPIATADINAVGVMNLLEAIRLVKPDAHFYQAATSEMFGKVQQMPQTEQTPFYPRSPYGVSKLFGFWITKIIGKVLRCSPAAEFYLIMKVNAGGKNLSPVRLQTRRRVSVTDYRTVWSLEIWMQDATGDTRRITYRRCGCFCKINSRKIMSWHPIRQELCGSLQRLHLIVQAFRLSGKARVFMKQEKTEGITGRWSG